MSPRVYTSRGAGVGGAAQKGDHQNEVGGLAFRQVRMNPQPVAGHEIGRLADRQGDIPPLYVHIDFGTGQVECRAVSVQQERQP